MLLDNQLVEIKITKANINHFRTRGYNCNLKENILANPSDLCHGSKVRVLVACDYCGGQGQVAYNNYNKHISNNGKYACKKCVGLKCADITKSKRQTKHYENLLTVCTQNGYKLLSKKEDIMNNETKISYLCSQHGVQTMKIANMLSGKKCPKCAKDKAREKYKLSKDEVINRFASCDGVVLNPDEYVNQTVKNMRIVCPECNNEFLTSLRLFTQHSGQVCPECSKHTESMGERKVRKFLDNEHINYLQEHWFNDCRDTKPLPFDFYLPELNTIIEFDGRQHFNSTTFFKHSQKTTHIHDKIKNEYCEKKGIKLIRIPYWNIDKIEGILSKEILHKDIV